MTTTARTILGCGLLLTVVVTWTARAVPDFAFVAWDDDINILFNPHLGPPGAATLKWMWTDGSYMRRYVPLGWLGLSSVYEVSGLRPAGYHTANLGFHVLNTLLLFGVLRALVLRWGRATGGRWATASAALGAALWALHPYRAETVGWASGLLYGPAGTFALLSVRAHLALFACEPGSRARYGWLALTAVAYLASLLSYPIGLGLAGVFVLMELAERWHGPASRAGGQGELGFAPRRGRTAALVLEKLGLCLPGLAVLAVTLLASFGVKSFWLKPATLTEYGVLPRLAQAAYAWGGYVWQRWWPVNLTPAPTALLDVYPAEPAYWLSALALAGVTVALAWKRAWRRGPLLAWLAFFILLFPVLGWTERPYFPNDRYDYLAGMVVSAVVVFALARVPERWRTGVAAPLLVGLGALAWAQYQQLEIWRDTDALKRRMIDASDNRAFRVTQYGLWAKYYAQRGDRARADELIAEGQRVCGPGPWVKDWREDVAEAGSAAALHARLGLDFSRAGRAREAGEQFRAALRLDPGLAAAAVNYAVTRALAGEPAEALHWYYHAVANGRDGVPPATRWRVLGLIADSYWAAGQRTLALRAAELAVTEAGSAVEAEPARQQVERFRAAVKNGP
jgi:tetratricopeptide (TPR) repeat protein